MDLPADARTVDSTWQHPNKSGGPDRRYRDNPQIPIVEYEQVWVESATGLNEIVQVSTVGAAAQFAQPYAAWRRCTLVMPGVPAPSPSPILELGRFKKTFTRIIHYSGPARRAGITGSRR